MNKQQRKSTASYFYDISKGVAILTIVENIIQDKWNIVNLVIGFFVLLIFFISAYLLEKSINND
ncbi:MAG: hypothetical protein IIA88_02385 [Bacteroidetes bacterium]|nr:hypothetical protein [Bacteroidota bacterium]